jgi:hypothetical protein
MLLNEFINPFLPSQTIALIKNPEAINELIPSIYFALLSYLT